MRKINKPIVKVEDILSDCISNYTDVDKVNRLKAISSDLTSLAVTYNEKGDSQKLHEIGTHINIRTVTKEELKELYTYKLVSKNQPGRKHYDLIRNSAPLSICPLCSQRPVSTVDHVLPKGSHPGLSITPFNLIPACKDCNTDKNELVPTCASEVHLHPYYDNVESERWLFAEVLQTIPVTFEFKVIPVTSWSTVLNNRIKFHFKTFNLELLYSVLSGAEIQELKYLKEMRTTTDAEQVKLHMELVANGRMLRHKNGWKTAMYIALSESDWFCQTGVLTL